MRVTEIVEIAPNVTEVVYCYLYTIPLTRSHVEALTGSATGIYESYDEFSFRLAN